jgi:hypothetical protein
MTILVAIVVWLPAVPAHAVSGSVQVFRPPTVTTPVTCAFSGGTTVALPTSCSSVQITARPGTAGAQAAALGGASQNQVVIRNVVLKNVGAPARVVIDAQHLFSGVVVTGSRAYGVGLNASFARKNAANIGVLAAGDQIRKQGFYTYSCNKAGGCTDQVGGAGNGPGTDLAYTVPSIGSTSLNTIPVPAPSASESPRNCASFGTAVICGTGETLRTVLSVTLAQNDQVTIPGGDHTVAGDAGDGFVNAVLASLTVVARLHQNTPNSRVNPFDNGFLTVELLCNADFRCEDVDQSTLRFGPGGAVPKSVKVKDVNGDGFADLQIKVRQPETGITCGDTEATVTGSSSFQGFGLLDFDAIVGFYTGPGC